MTVPASWGSSWSDVFDFILASEWSRTSTFRGCFNVTQNNQISNVQIDSVYTYSWLWYKLTF